LYPSKLAAGLMNGSQKVFKIAFTQVISMCPEPFTMYPQIKPISTKLANY